MPRSGAVRADHATDIGRPRQVRAVHAGLLLALVGAVYVFAPIGFNPTDDGLIVAQSARLLDGASPHLQVISPRPLGSPILHTVDVLLPTPLLYTSRAIAVLEFMVIAGLSVLLLRRTRLSRWGPAEAGLTLVAFLVNLHTFPLLSWHTVDGILVSLAAFCIVRAGCQRQVGAVVALGALVGGCAPLMKQSFAPFPVFLAFWTFWHHWQVERERRHLRVWHLIAALSVGVLPGIVYIIWVAMTSSLSAAVDQMTGASSVDPWAGVSLTMGLVLLGDLVGASMFLTIAWQRRHRNDDSNPRSLHQAINFWLALVAGSLLGLAIWTVWSHGLLYTTGWATSLWWLGLFSGAIWSVVHERLDTATIGILAISWMASLSWGYAVPNLMGGSLLVAVVFRCGETLKASLPEVRRPSWHLISQAAPIALAVLLIPLSVQARRTTVYRDVPAADQHADLGRVSDAAWGIRSNNTTASYLKEVRDCLSNHPADRLAVLPDNPVVPLLLGRSTPLPLDWWYPLEIPRDRERILDDVDQVSEDRDYLVLFQTVRAETLADGRTLPPAVQESEIFDYPDGMAKDVFRHLKGATVACGPFVGKYSPP